MVKRVLKIIGLILLFIVSTLLILVVALYGALNLAINGPSEHFRQVFVTSMMESSAGPIAIRLVLDEEEINAILDQNKVIESTDITDTSLISIMHEEAEEANAAHSAAQQQAIEEANDLDPDGDGIEIHEISGPTFHGMMMIVYDPSRVVCATISEYTHSGAGATLEQLINNYGAVAGINGGQYEDECGLGIGGWPVGMVFSRGSLRHCGIMEDADGNGVPDVDELPEGTEPPNPYEMSHSFCGFTNDDILIVGTMSAGYAQSLGVRDGCSFGPALIVNGTPSSYVGSGGGLNPRTAIGQREDGAVLMLCIEGRKTSSMGASMADLIDIMLQYGAVNAYNLDGGMSSSMYYNGEEIVDNANIRSDRAIPTAFVVLPLPEEEN